uniref:hypothetical protein n=1 Tax=Lachnoclostridium phocaeense TaxID=1871021 RepID=UPI0026DD9BB3|nr:hypothetical protein [Lachnoclostridium phocaeense]
MAEVRKSLCKIFREGLRIYPIWKCLSLVEAELVKRGNTWDLRYEILELGDALKCPLLWDEYLRCADQYPLFNTSYRQYETLDWYTQHAPESPSAPHKELASSILDVMQEEDNAVLCFSTKEEDHFLYLTSKTDQDMIPNTIAGMLQTLCDDYREGVVSILFRSSQKDSREVLVCGGHTWMHMPGWCLKKWGNLDPVRDKSSFPVRQLPIKDGDRLLSLYHSLRERGNDPGNALAVTSAYFLAVANLIPDRQETKQNGLIKEACELTRWICDNEAKNLEDEHMRSAIPYLEEYAVVEICK